MTSTRADADAESPILVVDDDVGVCLLIGQKLTQAGMKALCLHSGHDAVRWMKRNPARLVLLDLRLPDMDADAVLDALHREGIHPPFLVISGYADTKVAVDFMRRGALDYLIKDRHFLELVPDVVSRAVRAIEREELLAQLRREIVDISEREQRRIGQDLHDDLCQRLAAIKMRAHTLAFQLAENEPEIGAEVEEITRQLSEAVQVSRTLARGLAPVALDVEGLPAALEHLAYSAEQMFGMVVPVEMDENIPPIGPAAATQLYRIAQECLNNAARHGGAGTATLRMRHTDAALVLEVANDGIPFNGSGEANGSGGLGMHIMRHRAETLGATLEIDTQSPLATTTIRCILPLTSHPAGTFKI